MLTETKRTDLFCEYYAKWITVYKKGAIRKVTMDKYLMTQKWLVKLVPNLRVCDMNRIAYQQLLNDYAEFHERQTTMDFHHQLKGAILDAVDEGLIERDPTRKAIIKGKPPVAKKIKYLNQFELHTLLISLDLKDTRPYNIEVWSCFDVLGEYAHDSFNGLFHAGVIFLFHVGVLLKIEWMGDAPLHTYPLHR